MKLLGRSLLLLVTLTAACAHRPVGSVAAETPSTAAAAPVPLSSLTPRQAMWSVQGPKGKVVLLGSMHALKEKAQLRPEVAQTLATAERVVFESDFTNPAALQQELMSRGRFSGGLTLSRVLSPATVAALDEVVRPLGMTAAHLEQLEPWLVSFVVTATQVNAAGAKSENGVEQLLLAKAKTAGKQVLWLEEAAAVLATLDALPLADQETYLKATLKDPEQVPARLEQLARAWHSGDLAQLDTLLNEFRDQSPALHEQLLTSRNRNWLPGVEGFLNTGGETLVVVGAGHLVGEGSVVELLRAKGYEVQAL